MNSCLVLRNCPVRTHRPEYFFTTDSRTPLRRTVELYTRRWSIEVTVQEARANLGFGTTRVRCRRSAQRAEPWLLGCASSSAYSSAMCRPDR